MKIGDPIAPNYNVNFEILYEFQVHCEVFLLVYYLKKEIVLATSDDGIYCWNGDPKKASIGELRYI